MRKFTFKAEKPCKVAVQYVPISRSRSIPEGTMRLLRFATVAHIDLRNIGGQVMPGSGNRTRMLSRVCNLGLGGRRLSLLRCFSGNQAKAPRLSIVLEGCELGLARCGASGLQLDFGERETSLEFIGEETPLEFVVQERLPVRLSLSELSRRGGRARSNDGKLKTNGLILVFRHDFGFAIGRRLRLGRPALRQ